TPWHASIAGVETSPTPAWETQPSSEPASCAELSKAACRAVCEPSTAAAITPTERWRPAASQAAAKTRDAPRPSAGAAGTSPPPARCASTARTSAAAAKASARTARNGAGPAVIGRMLPLRGEPGARGARPGGGCEPEGQEDLRAVRAPAALDA